MDSSTDPAVPSGLTRRSDGWICPCGSSYTDEYPDANWMAHLARNQGDVQVLKGMIVERVGCGDTVPQGLLSAWEELRKTRHARLPYVGRTVFQEDDE